MDKNKIIGNGLILIGFMGLFIFMVNYIRVYTNITDVLKPYQGGSWLQIWFWLGSILLFIVGYIVLRWGSVNKDLRNWQKTTLKIVAEIVGIIYAALLLIVFFQKNLSWWFMALSIITIFILFYGAEQMRNTD